MLSLALFVKFVTRTLPPAPVVAEALNVVSG
jgi:hypothetical protein